MILINRILCRYLFLSPIILVIVFSNCGNGIITYNEIEFYINGKKYYANDQDHAIRNTGGSLEAHFFFLVSI